MLRPLPARWFEILAARDDATLVLEALARTDAVELEPRASVGLPAALGDVMPLLAQYVELSARHHAYWPPPERCRPSAFPEAPVATLQRSLATIRAWAEEAEPLIRALQRAEAEQGEWRLWQRVLPALGQGAPLPSQLAEAGPWLRVRLFVLPAGSVAAQALPGGAYVEGFFHFLLTGDIPSEADVKEVAEEFKKRSTIPKYVFDVLKAMPTDSHPMVMFSTAILAMQRESEFVKQYNSGKLKKNDYWIPTLEDGLKLLAKIPGIAAFIYRLKY